MDEAIDQKRLTIRRKVVIRLAEAGARVAKQPPGRKERVRPASVHHRASGEVERHDRIGQIDVHQLASILSPAGRQAAIRGHALPGVGVVDGRDEDLGLAGLRRHEGEPTAVR